MNDVNNQIRSFGVAAKILFLASAMSVACLSSAQRPQEGVGQTDVRQLIVGEWVINDELSDNSDDQV